MEIINAILNQFKNISLPWWIAIVIVAALLLVFCHKSRQIPADMLVIYVLIILASTVLTRGSLYDTEWRELVNLNLIDTWSERLSGDFYGKSELLLNFCMLLPVGVLFPWATKRGIVLTAIAGLGLIVVIEFAQLVTRRGFFELTDIFDNTVGVIIGYGIYRFGAWLWRRWKC